MSGQHRRERTADAASSKPLPFGHPEAIVAGFEELPAAVFVFSGPDHVFTAVNKGARAILGQSRDVIDRPYREAMPEVEGQRLAELLDQAYQSGEAVAGQEWRILVDNDGDGQLAEFFLSFTIVPTHALDGTVTGVIAHVLDVTDMVRERAAAQDRATAAEQRYQAALDVVETLQRNMLPDRLPVLAGLQIAAHYLVASTAQAAGGDWFDAVPLEGGRVGLVAGDVVGHGAAASAVMGQLRAVLMEFLLEGCSVDDALARLDRYAARLPRAAAATVCLAVLDPVTGVLSYASAGHPPPLLVSARSKARFLPVGSGGPLGVAGARPGVASAQLMPGDVLLMYTDGLVERPGRDVATGMDQMRVFAADALARGPRQMMAGAAVDRVCQLTIERMTRDGYSDDVTLLGVQLTAISPDPLHVELPATPAALATLRAHLDGWLSGLGASEDDVIAVQLAVGEAATNAIEHAYPDDNGTFRVDGELDDAGWAHLTVTDTGTWRPPPTEPGFRGRGMMLIHDCMDGVEIDRSAGGTTLLMDRELRRPPVLASDVVQIRPANRSHAVDVMLRVHITRSPSPSVTVAGPVDLSTTSELHLRLQDACRGGTLPLTLDLTGVSHLASAGVQLLYGLAEQIATGGNPLRLLVPPGCPAHPVVAMTGLDQFCDESAGDLAVG